MNCYKALTADLRGDLVKNSAGAESDTSSSCSNESDDVGAILKRTADFEPYQYVDDDDAAEEDYLPINTTPCIANSAFWDHLSSCPEPVDRTRFSANKDIAQLFSYTSPSVAKICCASNLTTAETQTLLSHCQDFLSEYTDTLDPEQWSLLAKLRACFDPGQRAANLVLYKQFLALFASRTSVVCTSPSYDFRTIYYEASIVHILNQAVQHADRRYRVSQCLRKSRDKEKDARANDDNERDSAPETACNGFTRTHTLVLLPTRHVAWRFVMMVLSLGSKLFGLTPHRLEEWEEKFGCDEEQRIQCPVQDGEVVATLSLLPDEVPEVLSEKLTEQRKRITAKWYRTFCGNTDDNFNFGIQIHGDKIILLTPLRVADIIVASPLGLRQQCNIDPTTDNTFKARAGDGFKIVNFVGMLSSLHTLFIGDVESLEMQNWEHFLSCIWGVNKPPREGSLTQLRNYACDIRTYLPAYLYDKQKLLLQVFAVSECFSEEFNKLLLQQPSIEAPVDAIDPILKRNGPVQSIPMSEAFRNCSLIHNSKGLIRITCLPAVYPHVLLSREVKDLRIILYRLEKGAVQERRTSAIDERRLKFSIKDYPIVDYFVNVLIPRLIKDPDVDKRMLVVVPNYYTMVRIVRVLNLLAYTSINWHYIEESATIKEITQARRRLENGVFNFLLVTERVLYYRQPPFSKLQTVIFLSPPTSAEHLTNTAKYFSLDPDVYRSLIVVYLKAENLTRLGNCFPPDVCLESTTKKTTLFLHE